MNDLFPSRPPPLPGSQYTTKLIRFLSTHKARLSQPPYAYTGPQSNQVGNIWQQTYTIATLGLDSNSSLLNPTLTALFSLGLAGGGSQGQGSGSGSGTSAKPIPARGGSGKQSSQSASTSASSANQNIKPLTLRLPADRLLYLILLFQSSSTRSISASPNIGATDIPIPAGSQVLSTQTKSGLSGGEPKEGDVQSVRSWTGSVRTVGGLFGSSSATQTGLTRQRQASSSSSSSWTSLFGSSTKPLSATALAEELDKRVRLIWASLTVLPSLTIHALPAGESLLKELVEEGTYNVLGGLEVKVPLNVFRSLWALELDGYDPRGVYIPAMPGLKSLTVKGVSDGEDWIDELLGLAEDRSTALPDDVDKGEPASVESTSKPRFPTLQYLSLTSAQLLTLPTIPCLSLTHLDISSNLLNAIPPSLISLPNLISLNLSNNMIESVRGAQAVILGVKALNLRNNRIDCLAGLDQLPSLERIDVRKNRLVEIGEVGRLSILPSIREIWVGSGNNFREEEEEDWRVKVFLSWEEEGREWPVVDGYPASWSEKRSVQGEMGKRGMMRGGRVYDGSGSGRAQSSSRTRTSQTAKTAVKERPNQSNIASSKRPARTDSPAPLNGSRGAPVDPSKRRRQRIVELDGSVRSTSGLGNMVSTSRGTSAEGRPGRGKDGQDGPGRGEDRHESLNEAMEDDIAGSSVPSSASAVAGPSQHSRSEHTGSSTDQQESRAGQAAVPSSEGTGFSDNGKAKSSVTTPAAPEDMRARMEALKSEVGDSWLKVLASQSKMEVEGERKKSSHGEGERLKGLVQGDRIEEGAGNVTEAEVGVVKVVAAKKGKKKKAVGEIK